MKITPDDFKTIQSYTGRKIKFITNIKDRINQSAYTTNNAILNMMNKHT
jgi:hypothetical protein